MPYKRRTKVLAAILSVILTASLALPSLAFASTSQVSVEDHATASPDAKQVSNIVIDGVEAPETGMPLDDQASVHTAEGDSWEIPVLWIDSDLELANQAAEGKTYLPALAFYVPSSFQVKEEGNSYQVTLSDDLTKLFGTNEIISIYNASNGITYILPATLRDFFAPHAEQAANAQDVTPATIDTPAGEPADVSVPQNVDTATDTPVAEPSLLDIYCAQTARDAFTDEDLSWLLDLVLNKLQPEAVNLLM